MGISSGEERAELEHIPEEEPFELGALEDKPAEPAELADKPAEPAELAELERYSEF